MRAAEIGGAGPTALLRPADGDALGRRADGRAKLFDAASLEKTLYERACPAMRALAGCEPLVDLGSTRMRAYRA